MTIRLARGTEADWFVASGGLAFDGRGYFWERWMQAVGLMHDVPVKVVVILKTLTMQPRLGNLKMYRPWGCVRRIDYAGNDVTFQPWAWAHDDGFVNAVGLTNPGFHAWMETVPRQLEATVLRTAVSIMPGTVEECIFMTKALCELRHENIRAIEVNMSCPNTGEDITKNTEHAIALAHAARNNSDLPIIIKLGYENDVLTILRELDGVELIVDLINTVRYATVYPEKNSPLAHLGGGGVSGPRIESFRDEIYRKVRKERPRFPIILGGGIHDEASLKRACALTPGAIAIGTALLKDPDFLVHHL